MEVMEVKKNRSQQNSVSVRWDWDTLHIKGLLPHDHIALVRCPRSTVQCTSYARMTLAKSLKGKPSRYNSPLSPLPILVALFPRDGLIFQSRSRAFRRHILRSSPLSVNLSRSPYSEDIWPAAHHTYAFVHRIHRIHKLLGTSEPYCPRL